MRSSRSRPPSASPTSSRSSRRCARPSAVEVADVASSDARARADRRRGTLVRGRRRCTSPTVSGVELGRRAGPAPSARGSRPRCQTVLARRPLPVLRPGRERSCPLPAPLDEERGVPVRRGRAARASHAESCFVAQRTSAPRGFTLPAGSLGLRLPRSRPSARRSAHAGAVLERGRSASAAFGKLDAD